MRIMRSVWCLLWRPALERRGQRRGKFGLRESAPSSEGGDGSRQVLRIRLSRWNSRLISFHTGRRGGDTEHDNDNDERLNSAIEYGPGGWTYACCSGPCRSNIESSSWVTIDS